MECETTLFVPAFKYLSIKLDLSLPMFRSGYSDLLQGEASMKHLSFYSLASHNMLSLELSVGAAGL